MRMKILMGKYDVRELGRVQTLSGNFKAPTALMALFTAWLALIFMMIIMIITIMIMAMMVQFIT